jgi:hypothetical protein
MTEEDFWTRLEYRVCAELAGMDDKALRRLWCDGIVPRQYLVDVEVPQIIGYAWIVTGTSNDAQWDFVFFLPGPTHSRETIAWAALLPPDGATEWLEIDQQAKTLRVHPTYVARA